MSQSATQLWLFPHRSRPAFAFPGQILQCFSCSVKSLPVTGWTATLVKGFRMPASVHPLTPVTGRLPKTLNESRPSCPLFEIARFDPTRSLVPLHDLGAVAPFLPLVESSQALSRGRNPNVRTSGIASDLGHPHSGQTTRLAPAGEAVASPWPR